MKLADVKWERLLELLPQWDKLKPDQRLLWLEMQPEERYRLPRAGYVRVLIDEEWFTPAGGKSYAVPDARRYFHGVLNALSRVAVLDHYGHADPQRLIDYLTAHFSARDCAALSRSGAETTTSRAELAEEMGGEEWLADFLRQEDPGVEPQGPGPQRWRLAPPAAVHLARQLIVAVLQHGAPISIADLLTAFRGKPEEDLLAPALAFACREALALVGLDNGGRLFFGVWRSPRAAQLAATPAESAPEFDRNEAQFCRPLLIDDMALLLVEATAAPPRLRADHSTLFARSRNTIARALTALPAWLDTLDTLGAPLPRGARADLAAESAHQLGLAAVRGDSGKDLRLEVTERGRRWLGLAAGARLKLVLDALRAAADDKFPLLDDGYYDDDDYDEDGEYLLPDAEGDDEDDAVEDDEVADEPAGDDGPLILERLDYLPYDPGADDRWYHPIECRAAVTAAFRSTAGAAAVNLNDFLDRWQSKNNPLTEGEVFLPLEDMDDLDEQWKGTLAAFFFRRLVALGGVTLGRLVSGRVGFRLTQAGRYLLKDTDQFEFDAAKDTGEVLVQPNFEIVFLAPSVEVQLQARAYAEPTAALEGPDSVGTLFVLRRESVQRAVRAGRDADGIVASLRRLSKHPLPDNVQRQVAAWAAEVRWIDVRPAVVVDCGDAETAARVLAAVGKNGRQLSATAVELPAGKKLTAAIRKKLGSAGIFVRS